MIHLWCLKICQVFAVFFVFKQKIYLLFIFADGGSWGSHNWSYNWSKYFTITTNSVIRSSSFFLNIQSDTFFCHREQPPTPSFPIPPMTKPKQSPCYFQLALNFLCEKNCGLMNKASWLAWQQNHLKKEA